MFKMRASAVALCASGAALAVVATAGATRSDDLATAKAASARYHSITQAHKHGYSEQDEPCVSSPDGTMGIHAVNRALTRDQRLDIRHPEIVLYVPGDDGKLELAGVEYFQVALANTPDGPAPWFGERRPPDGFFTPRPALFDRAFDGPMPGHNPAMPWHYDLHVWLWESNPSGLFAPFNPTLRCAS